MDDSQSTRRGFASRYRIVDDGRHAAEFKRLTGCDYPTSNLEWVDLLTKAGFSPQEQREIGTKFPDESEVSEYWHVPGALWTCLVARLRDRQAPPAAPADSSYHVTLRQAAAMVSKSKDTLERAKDRGDLPPPDVKGGGGMADEWRWDAIRPVLEKLYGRPLPRRHPSDSTGS